MKDNRDQKSTHYSTPNHTNLVHCEYKFEIPDVGICCGAYHKSTRRDGKQWAHYPCCEAKNCPLIHPDLLGEAELVFCEVNYV